MENGGRTNHVLRVCFPLLLLALITRKGRTIQIIPLCIASIFLVITSLFFVNLFSDTSGVFAIGLTTFLRGVALIFLFLVLIQYIQSGKYHSVTVIGMGRGLYLLAQSIAMAGDLFLNLYLDSALALNLIYIVLTIGLLCLVYVNKKVAKGISGLHYLTVVQ